MLSGQELYEWLSAFGWQGEQHRLRFISQVLLDNDLKRWYQFGRAGDPASWLMAESLNEEELSFLRSFIQQGKRVPRLVCIPAACWTAACCV